MDAVSGSAERDRETTDGTKSVAESRADTHFPSLSALLSRTLGTARRDTLDGAVEACLAHIGRYTDADMAFTMLLDDTEYVSHDWYWTRPGETYLGPGVGTPIALLYGSSVELLRLGHMIVVSDLRAIEVSPVERKAAELNDLRGVVLAPVRVHGTLLGICGLQAFREPRDWPQDVVNQLGVLAEQLVRGVSRTLERGELALADARARRIAEFIPDGLALLDLDGVIRWASPSLVRMTGRSARLLVGRRAVELVPDGERRDLADALAAATAEPTRLVAQLTTPEGLRWAELTWRVVSEPDAGVPDEVVFSVRDVHERQLEYMAMTALTQQDELTGVANRGALARRLEQLAAQGTEVLYAFVDLDGFKTVNDTHGHATGDRVLAGAADALRAVLRPEDVVARVGGDEFAIVIAQPLDPATLGDRLLAAVRAVDVGTRRVTASIGIAGPTPASDPDLTHMADKAMYRAKGYGKDCWAHLSPAGTVSTGAGAPTG
jgi:diguanylate cyclase (GGDEF)-like protein/PAS domain S-box-containing protein